MPLTTELEIRQQAELIRLATALRAAQIERDAARAWARRWKHAAKQQRGDPRREDVSEYGDGMTWNRTE